VRGLLRSLLVLAAVGAAAAAFWRLLGRRAERPLPAPGRPGGGAAADLDADPVIGEGRMRTAASYLDEGNVYFNVGQFELAIERYTRALEEAPDLPGALYNRAHSHTRLGEFDEALADYDATIALTPDDADALNNRGMLRLYRSEPEEALVDFERALALKPGNATVIASR